MPSLLDTNIAKNYRKQQVPYSRFGSRKIVWFSIGFLSNRTPGYDILDEAMNTLVDTIQTRAEIVTIGAPRLGEDYGRVTVGVFEDTFNNGNDTNGINDNDTNAGWNNMATTLKDALEAALADNNISVTQVYLYGGYSNNAAGWDDSNQYQEYDTKADFADNSYLHDDDNPLV
jgi:hypothetical protein